MNSGQPMWSHERDAYSLTKKEKGGRVWEWMWWVGWRDISFLSPVKIAFLRLRAARRQLPS